MKMTGQITSRSTQQNRPSRGNQCDIHKYSVVCHPNDVFISKNHDLKVKRMI